MSISSNSYLSSSHFNLSQLIVHTDSLVLRQNAIGIADEGWTLKPHIFTHYFEYQISVRIHEQSPTFLLVKWKISKTFLPVVWIWVLILFDFLFKIYFTRNLIGPLYLRTAPFLFLCAFYIPWSTQSYMYVIRMRIQGANLSLF